jgi:hypothetical protein
MAKLPTIQIRDLSTGTVQRVDNNLAPKNSVAFALNLTFDDVIGRAVLRDGSTLVGSQITDAENILGLHQFILSSGTKHLLTVIDGTPSQIYRLESGTWTTTGADGQMTAASKVRFLTYLDTVLALDGTLAKSSTDGTAWVTTGGNLDIDNCPLGKYAIEWNDRVYIAGVSGALDTLYYSGIATGGAISWTSGNGTIQIEPYEGQGTIVGLAKVPGYLLIFKERSMKRWNGRSTYPDDMCNFGSVSQEAIVNTKRTVMFFSASYKKSLGVYETNGESVKKISRPIQDIINGISSSNYSNIAGYSDGEFAMWSVGDVTYDGISYSNVNIYYHIDTQTWSVFSFPTKYTVFAPYIDSTTLKIVAGNSDGEILELFTGNTDTYTGTASKPIEYALQYHPNDLGDRSKIKDISQLSTLTKNAKEGRVLVRVDEEGGFTEIGSINTNFENEIPTSLSGHTFEFRIAGLSNTTTQLIGIDILQPDINLSIKE